MEFSEQAFWRNFLQAVRCHRKRQEFIESPRVVLAEFKGHEKFVFFGLF